MAFMVKKWGNSPAVRLPQAVMRAAHIVLEQEVRITAVAGKIIIEAAAPAYDIDEMVRAITAENRHGLVISSAERGAEEVNW